MMDRSCASLAMQKVVGSNPIIRFRKARFSVPVTHLVTR